MAIVIEDGTLVVGANSFVAVQDVRDYAAARGVDLSAKDDHTLAPHLVIAMDYLWNFDDAFRGAKVELEQSTPWPRTDVVLADGTEIADDYIPVNIKLAQCMLAMQSASGVDIVPIRTTAEAELKVKEIGPLKYEWFQGTAYLSLPIVDRLLSAYMSSGAGFDLRVIRA